MPTLTQAIQSFADNYGDEAAQQLSNAIYASPVLTTSLTNDFANGLITGFGQNSTLGAAATFVGNGLGTSGTITIGMTQIGSTYTLNNTGNDLTFVLGHEDFHAEDYATQFAADSNFDSAATALAQGGGGDYTDILATHQASEAFNEDSANIAGWNALVSANPRIQDNNFINLRIMRNSL